MAQRTLIVLTIVLASSVASAAGRVAILPFTGPKGSVPRDQLVTAVCAQSECVPQAKVSRRGRPDWAKVKRQNVDLVVTGAVSGPANRRVLQLEAFDRRGRRQWREKLELARNGKLSRSVLERASGRIIGAEEAKPPPEKKPEPPREEEKKPSVVAEEDGAEEDTGRTRYAESEAKPDRDSVEPEDAEPEVTARDEGRTTAERVARPIIVVEAGAALVNRNFAYLDLRQPNLRSYETRPVLFAPHLHLEAYPLAVFMSGLPQGLGVEADYQFAVGLRSIDENDLAHPTTVNSLDLGARLNWWPSKGLDLMVAPLLGYRSATFAVGPAEDGSELLGLPDLGYSALRFGAAVEYGLGPVVTFVRIEALPLLGLGELGSDAFFPDSGGFAFDARAGAGYRIIKNLEARLTLHYTRYGLTFRPAEGATYSASGAVDQYLGGSLSARFSY